MSALILVVDDDRSVRTSLVRLLSAYGYRACEAASAAQALATARNVRPDVILMDLQMPRVSGIAMARKLKRLPDLADVPLIALSASPPERALVARLFRSVLLKPCRAAHLIAAIECATRP